jgi:hypothetical protein
MRRRSKIQIDYDATYTYAIQRDELSCIRSPLTMASVGEDITREILLKLPTRDLVRYSCVCKLWHSIVLDPCFRTLHSNARHVVSSSGTGSAEAKTLAVSMFSGPGVGNGMTILNVDSEKRMCRFTDLAAGYSPVNACNGFLLLASGVNDWPLYVCNPVTARRFRSQRRHG